MRTTIRRFIPTALTFAAIAATGVGMYEVGLREGATEPVDMRVIYEESGEPYKIEVLRDGESVRVEQVAERWRGNDAAADWLYYQDPAGDDDQVHVAITYDESGEAATVTLTDKDGHTVPTGSVAETWTDDNTDAEG